MGYQHGILATGVLGASLMPGRRAAPGPRSPRRGRFAPTVCQRACNTMSPSPRGPIGDAAPSCPPRSQMGCPTQSLSNSRAVLNALFKSRSVQQNKRGCQTHGDVRQPRVGDRRQQAGYRAHQPGTSRLQHGRAKNAPASETLNAKSMIAAASDHPNSPVLEMEDVSSAMRSGATMMQVAKTRGRRGRRARRRCATARFLVGSVHDDGARHVRIDAALSIVRTAADYERSHIGA